MAKTVNPIEEVRKCEDQLNASRRARELARSIEMLNTGASCYGASERDIDHAMIIAACYIKQWRKHKAQNTTLRS